MGKHVCPYWRAAATDAAGIKRRVTRQNILCFGMAEPNYVHSVGVPYSKSRKFNSRVHEGVQDIAKQAPNHRHQATEEDDSHDYVIVAVHHGVVIE